MTNTTDKIQENIKENIQHWKHYADSILEQIKEEGDDLSKQFAVQRENIKHSVSQASDKFDSINQKGAEAYNEVQVKFKELTQKINNSFSTGEDMYDTQKEKLSQELSELETKIAYLQEQATDKTDKVLNDVQMNLRQARSQYDLLLMQYTLGKEDTKDQWSEKKKEIRKLAEDIKHKADSYSAQAEDKWDHMQVELKKSAEHLQKAFTS